MTRRIFALTTLSILAVSSAQTPAAPATVDTSAEKAAWEALMSPVGEYAAYATYEAIIQKYGQLEPYVSILRSEQMHINALTRQLQRYGVTVPANPYTGKVTLAADLKAIAADEAQTEVDNAAMYDKLMSMANGDAQLQRVFTNLRDASRNVHLELFKKAAAANGSLTTADMTNFHNQNVNNMGGNGIGMNGQRPGQGQFAQGQVAPGQRLGQQNQSGRGYNFNQPGNRGPGTTQGMGRGRGQMMGGHMGQMNPADCPMMNNQPGQGRGQGWRR